MGEEEIVLVLVLEVRAVDEQLWVQVVQVALIQVQVVLVQLKQEEELRSLPQ